MFGENHKRGKDLKNCGNQPNVRTRSQVLINKIFSFFFYSDQAEARRKKVKEARIRREQRIAQKKEEMLKNIEEAKK